MGTKTSQLQIRVSPEQKSALKRLAAQAGVSVSKYVLAAALPSSSVDFDQQVQRLRDRGIGSKTLSDFALYLSALSERDFEAATAAPDLAGVPRLVQNYVAAAVEQDAGRRDIPPPPWTLDVVPLPEPSFVWRLPSLQPHLLRVTPLTFKRRNLFVPPTQGRRP